MARLFVDKTWTLGMTTGSKVGVWGSLAFGFIRTITMSICSWMPLLVVIQSTVPQDLNVHSVKTLSLSPQLSKCPIFGINGCAHFLPRLLCHYLHLDHSSALFDQRHGRRERAALLRFQYNLLVCPQL